MKTHFAIHLECNISNGHATELEQATLFCEYFDFLIEGVHFTESELIHLGWETVKEFSIPFSQAVQNAIAYLFRARNPDA